MVLFSVIPGTRSAIGSDNEESLKLLIDNCYTFTAKEEAEEAEEAEEDAIEERSDGLPDHGASGEPVPV